MKKRRPLTEGLKPKKPDPMTEAAFITGKAGQTNNSPRPPTKPAGTAEPAPKPSKDNLEPPAATVQGRSPLTTRLRSDLAEALKRASLERQLSKVTPNTVQDILEHALEPWLRQNGYLKD